MISQLARNFSVLSAPAARLHDDGRRTGPRVQLPFFSSERPLAKKHRRSLQRKQKMVPRSEVRQRFQPRWTGKPSFRPRYQGRGAALWGLVAPGNRRWEMKNSPIPRGRSIVHALCSRMVVFPRALVQRRINALGPPNGKPVEFSILTSSSNADRARWRRSSRTT